MEYVLLSTNTRAGHWCLGDADTGPATENFLNNCESYTRDTPIDIDILRRGRAVDYCEAVLVGPIVRRELARAMQALAPDCIQLVPIRIPDHDEWEALNVLRADGLIDRTRSAFVLDDDGQIRYVREIALTPESMLANAHIFRVRDYRDAIIISSDMRKCMLDAGCEGAAFLPIPGPTVGPSMD